MAGEVDTPHPDYQKMLPDWELVRDALDGETAVKEKGELYLPKPSGFNAQKDGGRAMYDGYVLRAQFPEMMAPSIRGMVGIIHRVPAEINLPAQLEPMRERATRDGLPLDALHERITIELLTTGRFGMLTDMSETGADPVPYIAGYSAETILNWSYDHDFFVVDESHLERDGFEWKEVKQYRVLQIGDPNNPDAPPEDEEEETLQTPEGAYFQVVYKDGEAGEPIIPQMRGATEFAEIPFVIAGSTDVAVGVDEVPLLTVARCAFNIYRLDADYKHQLFNSGQETLFIFTDSDFEVTHIGAGVNIKLGAQGEAKYVGPSGVGIEKHKEAIDSQRTQAALAGAKVFDTERKSVESGDALRIRFSAQTATLATISMNGAKALEKALKYAAIFIGANPEEVSVKPNLNFIDTQLDPLKAKAIMELWMGGSISSLTMWENFQRGGIATQERTWEEEKELIDAEMPDIAPDDALPGGTVVKPAGAKPTQTKPAARSGTPQVKLVGQSGA